MPVQVGVNAFGTAEAAADLAALGDAGGPDGLAASRRAGRALGFAGRCAIHPRQLPTIVDAFRPTAAELRRAEELLGALAAAATGRRRYRVLPVGRLADRAMAGAARRVVALSRRYRPG